MAYSFSYKKSLAFGALAVGTILPNFAFAQNQFATPTGQYVIGGALLVPKPNSTGSNGQPQFVPPSSSAPLPISCPDGTTNCFAGGGGGGGTSSAFSAAFPANGTAVGMTDGTNMQPFKGDTTNGVWANVKTSVLPTGAALETGGNLAQLVTDSGAPGATACATDTGSCNFNQLFQRIAQRLTTVNTTLGSPFQAGGSIGNTTFASTQSGTWTVQPGNTANTTPWLTQPSPGTTGGTSFISTQVANNTTAVVIKASAGQVYGIRSFNNSAIIAYGKIYNATSATCGTGTPTDRFMIQPNSNGGFIDMMGETYNTGITVCITLAFADNDTTAPAANAYEYTVVYK